MKRANDGGEGVTTDDIMVESATAGTKDLLSESASTVTSDDASTAVAAAPSQSNSTHYYYDDAGSSRLFQPHRSLGLLTASHTKHNSSRNINSRLFSLQRNKFHLQPQGQSSDESFVTVPLGDRFQIMSLSKLVPVLVSRTLPPSASHHRRRISSRKNGGGRVGAITSYNGGDEEEIHQAVSDSSLSVTVVTHGPKVSGRAVSITLFSRTRHIACLDAFPFLSRMKTSQKNKKNNNSWGIVDMIHLGKHRVAMSGEKEGKMENALLLAIVCARGDDANVDKDGDDDEEETKVQVVGNDDSDEESDDISDENNPVESDEDDSAPSAEDNDDDDGSMSSLEDIEKSPAKHCHGRVLLVQASRTTLEILKTIELNGAASDFIPFVGLHPATYVNKVLLGGRSARAAADDNNSTSMLLLNVRTGKIIHSFRCISSHAQTHDEHMTITTLAQSPAVDTIAVGTSDGAVHLINTLHDVKLFSLQHKSKQHHNKKAPVSMNAVVSLSFRTDGNATRQGVAPLAVGCDDGSISVWDLTPVEDENNGSVRRTLLTHMKGVHFGGISKLEYLPGEPLLLSTGLVSNSILLHVFDAPDHSGRILRQRKGHTSPPTLIRYLHPGVSGGGILANVSDGTDASSCQILSCGGPGDLSLRLFSTARSNLDKEYSQGPGLEKKAKKLGKLGPEGRAELLLPEVVGLATSEARSRDWGDLVTIHRNHAMAYVWSTKRGAQSGPVLRQPQWNISAMKDRPPRSANATSLAISACGNFALVGTMGGVVYKYNLQSGLPRGSYPRDATVPTAAEERQRLAGLKRPGDVGRTMRILEKNSNKGGALPSDIDQAERDRLNYLDAEAKRKTIIGKATHADAVVGIAIDSLNKTVITAGADSKLVLWNFVTHMPHKKSPILLPSSPTKLTHVRDSDLAAIAMADFGVAVFDCSNLNIVRYFGGSRYNQFPLMSHTSSISDLQFGPDGRKLFTSSFDGTLRAWDVPTGMCVDWLKFSSPPTSLALSPTGEFLATSHVGRLGISLWCDKSFFRMVLLDGTPTEPAQMNEPCPVAECEQEEANNDFPARLAKRDIECIADASGENEVDDGVNPQPKQHGLITLSGLPPAHWKNLFHLELVKERNKPTEAPQKPPQAPFFLQWRSGIESGTSAESNPNDDGKLNKDSTGDWDAVWSDDDDNAETDEVDAEKSPTSHESSNKANAPNKRKKVVHHRSKLAELLQTCNDAKEISSVGERFSDVTSYLATMGPSSIDVELSSLCYGMHDLDDGLPLLLIASKWLLEACETHERFEAINAYLHRFLHVHGNVIIRIDNIMQERNDSSLVDQDDEDDDPQHMQLAEFVDTIGRLQLKQKESSNRLQGKMQHTICLLRHLSRMV